MTDRSEIERLLNQTGRTLEGLPEFYPEEQAHALYCEVVGKKELWEDRVLHQIEVIDLLVGALRDALNSQETEISDAEFEEFSKNARKAMMRRNSWAL